jgi:thiol-disulfide isomerase/thioredoxin
MNAVSSLALLALFSVTGDTVLLQFSSQRCTNCQAMQPVVNQLAQAGVQVHSIDVDQQQAAAQQFQIRGVPTYVAFAGGRELARIEGVTTAEKLASLVQARGQESAVRGQGTGDRGQGTDAPDQTARAATVRLKVEDATGYGYGTGTIIDTHDSEALVVTCGHLFRESKGAGKISADLFATGSPQTVDGQLIAYDLDRDIALVSLRVPAGVRPVHVAPPGYNVRPGDRAFTVGCDKGADPSIRATHITAVNKYKGKPNFTAAGQPIDGRSGGGLFSAEGHLIGICNAADPADDEGLYAGLASIHWQLDQIGQSEIYQRAARVAAAANPPRDAAVALVAAQTPAPATSPIPPLPPQMPAGPFSGPSRGPAALEPIAVGDDTEIVFIVRSKRNPAERSEVYVVDQAAPDLVARITHAARASGEQRAALARANQPPVRTASAGQLPGAPSVVRGQSGEY